MSISDERTMKIKEFTQSNCIYSPIKENRIMKFAGRMGATRKYYIK